MSVSDTIRLYLENENLTVFPMEPTDNDYGYVTTYNLAVHFVDEQDSVIGELMIYFKVIGYGIDGFDGGIETFFNIPYFVSGKGKDGESQFFDEVEGYQFIFSNFGSEIQYIINEDGVPLPPLID